MGPDDPPFQPGAEPGLDLHRQKLESLGLLAGGIAHDFNNLLGAMLGNLELAQLALDPEGTRSRELQALGELIVRAASLVDQVLAYAGRSQARAQALDLNHQVEAMLRILRPSLARKAALDWQPGSGLPDLQGDPAQVNQVIMNVLLNASEALEPEGGTLTVRTGRERLDPEAVAAGFPGQALEPGEHVALEVADTGSGMPADVLGRIFEPFFSTKPRGRGLGLAAVQGILRGHRGGIQVASAVGAGTRFRILFPAAASRAAGGPGPVHGGFPAFRGHGTVLVVDDEPHLRRTTACALRRMGLEVLEARDGEEALQRFAANRDRIDLVLMDLTMPRLDGVEAYRRLRRAGARQPIVLTSGFSQEEARRRFQGRGPAGFLLKPYSFRALAAAVEAFLGPVPRPWPAPVAWLPEYETGCRPIDSQHQGLVDGYNRLVAAALDPGSPAQATILEDLAEAAARHFGFEERLMGRSGYPETRSHRDVHRLLARQVRGLARDLARGRTTLDPATLHFLEDWLLCHITTEDRDLVRHLGR